MIPGQRFEVDLDDGQGDLRTSDDAPTQGAFVGDVLERNPTATAPPAAPSLKTKTGFPGHRPRKVESKFKQQKKSASISEGPLLAQATAPKDATQDAVDGAKDKTWEEEEKQRIDQENRQKLADMSPDEIEEERRELFNSFSPDLLQRLLQRSNIDSGSAAEDLSSLPPSPDAANTKKRSSHKTVSFAEPAANAVETNTNPTLSSVPNNDDLEAPPAEHPIPSSVHFPRPQQPPDLDPSSETFFDDLHTKYFPALPSDPEKLEWMQSTQTSNIYDPTATALSPKDIRFSFTGQLIPPSLAAEIPVTAGLHHHGDAPDAAGYTIPELARLAQSSYAAQRCIAFQTLGRILFRLGNGEFGDSGEPGDGSVDAEDTFGELARGLWREVEKERVIEILVGESEGQGVDRGRHISSKSYATEAVWLWQKGGGRRWKAY